MSDLTPFRTSLDEMFRKLGLPDPVVMSRITQAWDEVAGTPWSGRSKPMFIREKTLVVEASAPSMVAFLRYGSAGLVTSLSRLLGEGIIEQIEVRAPSNH